MERNDLRILSMAVVLVAMASAIVMTASDTDAETYDGTIDLYGYKITMGLIEPNQVSTVEWDFGDGSETVTVQITADNPVGTVQHVYSEKGDYVVTATMRNQYTDPDTGELKDGESKLTYLYHIYGYPVVTFESNGGSAVASIEGTSSHYVPTRPADPVKAGSVFTGWFADEGCTKAFDWTSEVTKHTTLYAGWEVLPATEYTSTLRYDANGGTGAPADDTYTGTSMDAHAFTVASIVPVRDGYRFDGWADTSDASEAVYVAGNSISVDADGTKTIYAVWSKILTVAIDAPESAVIGSTVTVRFTVNDHMSDSSAWRPDSADKVADVSFTTYDGYTYVCTFKVVKAGTLGITFTVGSAGCVTATETVEIQVLSNGVTAPPSAEGIRAEVEG